MTPEEIEAAEFYVGMRGFEQGEVRAFLRRVAAHQRQLERGVAELEVAAAGEVDPVDLLGQQVAAVVRSARDAAQALTDDAERRQREATARSEELVATATQRHDALQAASKDLVERLDEAVSSAQLALAVLRDDGAVDPREHGGSAPAPASGSNGW